jgi:hypothetical protein
MVCGFIFNLIPVAEIAVSRYRECALLVIHLLYIRQTFFELFFQAAPEPALFLA